MYFCNHLCIVYHHKAYLFKYLRFYVNENMTNDINITYKRLSPNDIQQVYPDTCAIKAQQIILESKGISVSEDDLIQESIDNDLYHPGNGTKASDVGNLLENYGLEVSKYNNGSIQDIADCLSSGKQIIVGVDSGELWSPNIQEEIEDFAFGGFVDHAVIVDGVSINSLTGEQEISITDPGNGDLSRNYASDVFLDAWNDSDNFMVVID